MKRSQYVLGDMAARPKRNWHRALGGISPNARPYGLRSSLALFQSSMLWAVRHYENQFDTMYGVINNRFRFRWHFGHRRMEG